MMATFYRKIMFLDDAMIVRPVTAEDIKWANNELENSNLPLIPTGYADFLNIVTESPSMAWNFTEQIL